MTDKDPMVFGPHTARIHRFNQKMEEAMRELEGWVYPLEVQVAMQPIYHAWGLLHSLGVRAYYDVKRVEVPIEAPDLEAAARET